MKTLNEVITALECCCAKGKTCRELGCPYTNDRCVDNGMEKDALHYLKEYQTILPLVPSLINTALEVQKKGKTIE